MDPEGFSYVKLGKWDEWRHIKTNEFRVFGDNEYASIDKKLWKPLGKAPIEKSWQNKFYSFEQIAKHESLGFNCGIFTGLEYKKGIRLGVLDDDTKSAQLQKLYDQHFPETMQVHRHYYIGLKNWDGKRIVFHDGKVHLGELQGIGQQVLCEGSKHPSGETYNIIKNLPITEIEFSDFAKVFSVYMQKTPQPKAKTALSEKPSVTWQGQNVSDIPLTNIISLNGLKN